MINPFTHLKVLRKGMPGRATIVASHVPARGARSFNLAMTLQVQVEGITPYEVEDQWMVKAKDVEALASGGAVAARDSGAVSTEEFGQATRKVLGED